MVGGGDSYGMPCDHPRLIAHFSFECKEEVPLDILLDVLKDRPDLVDKIHRFGLSRALQRDPNARFCPQANCSYAVILSRKVGKKKLIKCDCCHESFCVKCREPAHEGTCSFHDDDTVKPCPQVRKQPWPCLSFTKANLDGVGSATLLFSKNKMQAAMLFTVPSASTLPYDAGGHCFAKRWPPLRDFSKAC